MKANINVATILNIGGLVLGVAGTILTGVASQKKNTETLEKLVEEALKNK